MTTNNPRPIRVLRIINRLNIGGPTYNVAYLSKFLSQKYETQIVSGMIEPGEGSSIYVLESLGLSHTLIPTMFRNISPKNDWKSFKQIRAIINEFKPDIVHTHAAKAGALGRTAALFSSHKPKLILHTYHGNIFDGYFSKVKSFIFLTIERTLARFTTAIISISPLQKDDLVHKYEITIADKIHVIPLGFMLDQFSEDLDKKRIQIRNEFKISENQPLVVITGRLTSIKNHIFFIDVLTYCKNVLKLNFSALIVGDGELREELIQYAKDADLSTSFLIAEAADNDLVFTSFRKDIDAINAAADLVVLTSINEGTPVSIIEAMAAGRAVITTPVGGVSDFIENHVNGIICETNLAIFANEVGRLLSSKSLRFELGNKAKKSVKELFDYKRLVSDMDALYTQLLNNKL
jgi:glycosyltransferase involved in cell wall biosynthesis